MGPPIFKIAAFNHWATTPGARKLNETRVLRNHARVVFPGPEPTCGEECGEQSQQVRPAEPSDLAPSVHAGNRDAGQLLDQLVAQADRRASSGMSTATSWGSGDTLWERHWLTPKLRHSGRGHGLITSCPASRLTRKRALGLLRIRSATPQRSSCSMTSLPW